MFSLVYAYIPIIDGLVLIINKILTLNKAIACDTLLTNDSFDYLYIYRSYTFFFLKQN